MRHISDYLYRLEQKLDENNPIAAISYALMDIHDYTDIGCSTSGDSLEVFFDVSTLDGGKKMVAFMDLFFQRVTELENGWLPTISGGVTGTPMFFPGYCSLRFMSRSFALLAPQKWPRVCSIEIAGFRAAPGTEPFLARVEQDAVEMGAAIHWGQRNKRGGMKEIEKLYGAFFPSDPLARWRKVLSDLSEHGRHPTFSTAFTRDRGLEVVVPQAESFTVSPTEGCVGEPVRIEWGASKNPPRTTARLEIVPLTSLTPTSVIPLGTLEGPWELPHLSLSGTRDVPLPPGRAEFRFVVERELNYRKLTHAAVVPVRGFSDHEVWTFKTEQAVCDFFDGAARWSMRISLAGSVSLRLQVEEIYCRFSVAGVPVPGGWRGRRYASSGVPGGLPDVVFTTGAMTQPLPAHPALRGDWRFFLETAGCSGVPPEVHVELKIVCGP